MGPVIVFHRFLNNPRKLSYIIAGEKPATIYDVFRMLCMKWKVSFGQNWDLILDPLGLGYASRDVISAAPADSNLSITWHSIAVVVNLGDIRGLSCSPWVHQNPCIIFSIHNADTGMSETTDILDKMMAIYWGYATGLVGDRRHAVEDMLHEASRGYFYYPFTNQCSHY